MKKLNMAGVCMALLCLFFTSELFSQSSSGEGQRVRILTFNILHGETLKGDFDLDFIARVIQKADPDLVALQEVDLRTQRARDMDLVSELGLMTRLNPIFGRAMFYDGGEYGEGILSRYSFLSTRNHLLPAGEGKEPRAALEVQIQLPQGDTLTFVGTHLDHTENEADRHAQAIKLNALFAGEERPMILCGDLNARPESATMTELFSKWTASDPEFSSTFPSKKPMVKIDYVLFKPAHRWKVIESRVICDTIASDHCAQLTVLELL